jgi:hypothetical protein
LFEATERSDRPAGAFFCVGVYISSQNPEKRAANAHAYSVELADRRGLVDGLADREADVMVEAKGKEHTRSSLLWA